MTASERAAGTGWTDGVALRGKVAIVTGGASGLGRATALTLAEAGARVVVADLDARGGREVAEMAGGHFRACDVSDPDANRALVEFTEEQCGGVDIALLNAGVATGCGLGEDFDLARYRRAMGANLDGVVFGTHALLPAMRARGGGVIVATASLAGLAAVPLDPLYAANKHAVVGLARSLGPALATENVRFNAVCPGFAESRIIDPLRDMLAEQGLPIIPAQVVADTVLRIVAGGGTGECWFIQAGRDPEPFRFRTVPGPGEPAAA
ncbi:MULTISPECIES: SDR family NAD(P)-dependent oxidoreductase [unclassified Streptomyces]|uniref:SDR family NAD(P)-dependent oxidoreductase n=1 Tax=unclassified Streptomyces TaxID=2593676 RepID=UPI001F046E10|nr:MULTISPECIES: SDR family NAD(P)-dependent oxidoreductase [unclassified Streptomyces]MCH0564210.1 SDR family NAD(P)-dependent oxidoreductase [Streptomyces sp. MUM 2J]MCH0568512.1 SDR family NAD(P)-dependent oxidoreductase [Streptomyces sp. MUM 136J]